MAWPPARAASAVAVAAVLLNLLVAPFHAAAYFATEDGSQDLFAHQAAMGEGIRAAFPSLYDGDAYATYLLLGKATALSVALFAVAFAGLHGVQDARLHGSRRIVGRTLVGAWTAFGVLVLAEYFTPFTDAMFLVLLPVLLATLVLSGVYGWMTSRVGVLPRRAGFALLVAAVAFIPLVIVFGHIPFGLYAFSAAWIVLVPVLWRAPSEPAPAALAG